jgi:tetratricopeptide (TPR) repeat protein
VNGANSANALTRVSTLIDLGRFAQAAQDAGTILAAEPHNPRALCLLARARLGLDDNPAALKAAEAAIAADLDNEWAFRIASVALDRMGMHYASVKMARSAVRVAPHLSDCHARLALALAALGTDFDEAQLAADRAVQLNPHSLDAHLAAGAVAAAEGRREDARSAYERALAIDPTSSTAHNNLARLHLRLRR